MGPPNARSTLSLLRGAQWVPPFSVPPSLLREPMGPPISGSPFLAKGRGLGG